MDTQQTVTQPLRISKNNTPVSSPGKSSTPRPLSEIPVTEKRRNSPSWNQAAKKMALGTDSSPFQSSPVDGTSSPRLFWQNRNSAHSRNNSENDLLGSPSASPSSKRRTSIERLQKASRVKNSTMFAREQKSDYDPSRVPALERPLAKVQGNAFGGAGLAGLRTTQGHGRNNSQASITLSSPSTPTLPPPPSPSRNQTSPMKSSLSASRFKNSLDSRSGEMSNDTSFDDHELPLGKSLQRNMKSVTFDNAPPQINEYEMATPDISSIGTNSREGSYESDEEEDDDDVFGQYMSEDGDLHEDSFDATLEDTDKTPVVGPDDWRQDHEDRFDSSPMPEAGPSQASPARPQPERADSVTSSGEHRPLPPLPGMGLARANSASSNATTDQMAGSPRRTLPSPPPTAVNKADLHNIGTGQMSLEERLKLMMLDETSPKLAEKKPFADKSVVEQQRERRMRRAGARDRAGSSASERDLHESEAGEEDDTLGDLSAFETDYQLPSISRSSILKRVNGNKALDRDSDFNLKDSSPAASNSERPEPLDPDVPIASIEDSMYEDMTDHSLLLQSDDEEDKDDVYDLEETPENGESEADPTEKDDVDSESQYSVDQDASPDPDKASAAIKEEDDSIMTPRAATPAADEAITRFSATLPQVNHSGSKESDFARSFQSCMLPKPKEADATTHIESRKVAEDDVESHHSPTPQQQQRPLSKPEYDGSGWGEPEEEEDEEEEPGTPESVIHHPVSDSEIEEEPLDEMEELEEEPHEEPEKEPREEPEESIKTPEEQVEEPIGAPLEESQSPDEPLDGMLERPEVPERVATIKSASGSKLKTRPSATPSDIVSMRETRRHISREVVPDIPSIPTKHRNRLSRDGQIENADDENDEYMDRHPSFKKRSLTLDLDLGLSLGQDFERVIEAQKVAFQQLSFSNQYMAASGSPSRQASKNQVVVATDKTPGRTPGRKLSKEETLNANITDRKQRGYLMRQNTKLVTASDKPTAEETRDGIRSAGNSPTKQTSRPQSWTVEPWNGRPRQRSVKKRNGPNMSGPVPPMPGRESNATAAASIQEEEAQPELATDECGERGRLFVKVMGVKDLDLPLPKTERTWFSLTLDNGVHCVTTAWLELARNAPIGQEFELVVPNDLEFQLTLNVKLERPAEIQRLPTSPTKTSKPTKTSTFSRVFASPKKRKEMEARMRAEEEAYAQAQRDAATRQRKVAPSAWDLLSPLAAEDGSFARSYVCLKEHESRCYGRPYMAEIAAFNEWATEEPGFASSVKSKRAGTSHGVVRRAPYKIGKLEVQLLFVPRPKGAADEDMPKSMNSCIRELKAAEERLSRNWEGHLSQQGGDCPYWRRRYFKLVGTRLTAYHEATRQPRATINLSNAKRLIDDRRALTQPDTTARGGKRRRSAFAEEEEGYMFVEEGFRIRFNNGEVIDFYADTAEDKEGWMRVLSDVIGRGAGDEDEAAVGGGAPGGQGSSSRRKWCELVLKREETLRKRAEGKRVHSHSRAKSMIV